MLRFETRSFSLSFVELDIDAEEIAALARNDERAAFVGRLDRRFQADVGEVGNSQQIHDAPGLAGRVPAQLSTKRLAHGAARAVATDDELGLHRLRLPNMRGIEALKPNCNRIGGIRLRDR